MVAARAHLPAGPGVYRFRDANGRALYIGRAVNLRRRVASYWGDLRDRPRLRRMVTRIDRIDVLLCASEHEAAWLERNALEHSRPTWNRMLGGVESSVVITLDTSARRPGIKVSFTPGPDTTFGPYLSGTRTRLAVSALHRLFPLSYTSDRLSDAEREMAEKLLVRQEDRPSFVSALCTILDREPQAVATARQRLVGLRDAASAELNFERAGQLHEEIIAFDWITSPQRVTALVPYDAIFHGWAAGTLVRFEVAAGRLVGWRTQACTQERAGAKVAATPPQWQEFAELNAQLAAKLSSV